MGELLACCIQDKSEERITQTTSRRDPPKGAIAEEWRVQQLRCSLEAQEQRGGTGFNQGWCLEWNESVFWHRDSVSACEHRKKECVTQQSQKWNLKAWAWASSLSSCDLLYAGPRKLQPLPGSLWAGAPSVVQHRPEGSVLRPGVLSQWGFWLWLRSHDTGVWRCSWNPDLKPRMPFCLEEPALLPHLASERVCFIISIRDMTSKLTRECVPFYNYITLKFIFDNNLVVFLFFRCMSAWASHFTMMFAQSSLGWTFTI